MAQHSNYKEEDLEVINFLSNPRKTSRMSKALKSSAATVAAVSTLLVAAFALDGRYVHADSKYVTAEVLAVESLKQQQQVSRLQYDTLDDKIFELELRRANAPKGWTAMDQLVMDRYKSRLRQVSGTRVQQSQAVNAIVNQPTANSPSAPANAPEAAKK